jgi:flavorubredoxin
MRNLLFFFSIIINLSIFCSISEKEGKDDIVNIGINDKNVKQYEEQFSLTNGISFNSYAIIDQKIMIINGVGKKYENEWLKKVGDILGDQKPVFFLVQHMEPDSSESIISLVEKYPEITIISSEKSFALMKLYYNEDFLDHRIIVKDGDTIQLGRHILHFIEAPMMHWPEAIATYDSFTKTLFSCEAFGKFGINDVDEPWKEEARRYYFGIIGKYGTQVQSFLKKISKFEINNIFPNHGPILSQNINHYISLYDKWSKYEPEEEGVVIVYSTVYGHTKVAVDKLSEKLKSLGVKYVIHNLSFSHISSVISDAFKYSKLVLASITYHDAIYPSMRIFVNNLISRNFQSRDVSIIENYSWKSNNGAVIIQKLKQCKNLALPKKVISINSSVKEEDIDNINKLAIELSKN